jgi:hypothetical protein
MNRVYRHMGAVAQGTGSGLNSAALACGPRLDGVMLPPVSLGNAPPLLRASRRGVL